MDIEILITGTEVTNGSIVDTNSAWLARRAHGLGIVVRRKTSVGDRMDDLLDALRSAVRRSDAVVMSGGLGPTEDDLTRKAVARAAGVPLRFLPAYARALEARYRARGFDMPRSNLNQAWVPRGARVLPNPVGTAPGFVMPLRGVPVYALPGVPSELRAMFDASVASPLAARAGRRGRRAVRELLVPLLAEAVVGERTVHALRPLAGQDRLEVGWMIGKGGVIVRLVASERDSTLLRTAFARLRREFGNLAIELGEHALEEIVARELMDSRTTLAVAESCTGGLVCELLTRVPGISAVFPEGVVAYSNRTKTRRLGVPASLLRAHGAVSRETALAMARGVARSAGARLGLAVTGIAGPGGGTPAKPVGLVYVAARLGRREVVEELRLGGDRASIRLRSATFALFLVRRMLREAR